MPRRKSRFLFSEHPLWNGAVGRRDIVDAKKAPGISSGALLCCAEDALINYNIFRLARADHPLRIYKAVYVNRDPAVIHEHEVRVADQPEMTRPVTLDEELFRMPAKTEHFGVTRLELLLVHRRRLARARTCPSLSLVYFRAKYFICFVPSLLLPSGLSSINSSGATV
jgi:hypothetical protein